MNPAWGAYTLLAIFLAHAAANWLFTAGFLLTRRELVAKNACSSSECTFDTPLYKKAIVLIVDALRADFVVDTAGPHLQVPVNTTRDSPQHAHMYHFIADAPTTTLQRIKGLTTGSLPTFIDAGDNFGGESIKEDNWVAQAARAGKRLVFAGDDTWTRLFPISAPSSPWTKAFPYDSFNVHDLDTVDRGVAAHVHAALENQDDWDILIGHNLGLDHAGHTYSATHDEISRKLRETDEVIASVMSRMSDDTILFVFGDHGMTSTGDHGGDSHDEIDAALYVYSKKDLGTRAHFAPLLNETCTAMNSKPNVYDHTTARDNVRSVSQIDFVPTLSLLLGLPIPYGSLGIPIPELFFQKSTVAKRSKSPDESLLHAFHVAAQQVYTYVTSYPEEDTTFTLPELQLYWSRAVSQREGIQHVPKNAKTQVSSFSLFADFSFIHRAREMARAAWATFDPALILLGLIVWFVSLLVVVRHVYVVSQARHWIPQRPSAKRGLVAASLGGGLAFYVLHVPVQYSVLFGVGIGLVLSLRASLQPQAVPVNAGDDLAASGKTWPWILAGVLVAIHSLAMLSNSFVVYEDHIVFYLLAAALLALSGVESMSAPTADSRKKILLLGVSTLAVLRIAFFSTICRDEQSKTCVNTFNQVQSNPKMALFLALGATISAYHVPSLVQRLWLSPSKSDHGAAPFFLLILRVLYVLASVHDVFGAYGVGYLKLFASRTILVLTPLVFTLWYLLPANLRIERAVHGDKTSITILGFANLYGSSYLLVLLASAVPVLLVHSPLGKLVTLVHVVVLLLLVDLFDTIRDARYTKDQLSAQLLQTILSSNSVSLDDTLSVPPSTPRHQGPSALHVALVYLLGFSMFFATGHQSTFTAIQWHAAFVVSDSPVYPLSPAFIGINALGAHVLSALAVPLLALWSYSPPTPGDASAKPLLLSRHVLRALLVFGLAHATVAFFSALAAALLRRHLMVWKIFAPRYMLAGLTLLTVDGALLLAYVFGYLGVLGKSAVLGKVSPL